MYACQVRQLTRGAFFDNIGELGFFDGIECFTTLIELFEGFDDGFSHPRVCLVGAADK